MKISQIALAAALSSCLTPMAQAQSDDPLDGILACRNIGDVEARLSCFDTTAASLAEARQTGDVMTVSREDVENVERDSFGFIMPSLPRLRLPVFAARASLEDAPAIHDALDGVGDETVTNSTSETAPSADTVMASADVAPASATSIPPVTSEPEQHSVEILERTDNGGVFSVSMNVTNTRTVGYNVTVFYMENGQVWRQTDGRRVRIPSSDNLTAEIRQAALDSYLLRINGEGRAIRVERQR